MAETTPANPHGFTFNHTMLRIKDPEKSLEFYCGVLGMTLLRKVDVEAGEFSLYFLGFTGSEDEVPQDERAAAEYVFSRQGVLELTHNWGTEDEDGPVYHDGNSDPRGFGHIALDVPDLDKAVAHFDAHGVTFQKRPEDGMMKHIAFIKDPDGYWVEILDGRTMAGG
ncbi:lactoylglutathione lyase [Qipengyuania spongiae]|uniref:lactoylglutathione lyase n=1 Tax=Qipengyuania spongiae TaxID=2909673 RepID=A0ABY5T4G2_9SPHN|nr:lactoylglutathione lyase [Qipengyuania spongiae]UVI40233.1 lactoylglutathione lyase [Qipengyuania spongiae]